MNSKEVNPLSPLFFFRGKRGGNLLVLRGIDDLDEMRTAAASGGPRERGGGGQRGRAMEVEGHDAHF